MAITNGYLTLEEAKDVLGATITSAVRDGIIDRAVEAASREIDRRTGRRFYLDGSASARRYRAADTDILFVDDFDAGETVTVKTDDDDDGTFEITWAAGDFLTEPLNADTDGEPGYRILAVDTRRFLTATRNPHVEVTATWGWPSVPVDIEQACSVLMSRLFKRKDAPFGVAGDLDVGQLRLAADDPEVKRLLAPFRKFRLAGVG